MEVPAVEVSDNDQFSFLATLANSMFAFLFRGNRNQSQLLIIVLHTWTQTLNQHPHIHMIILSGGLFEAQMEWDSLQE